jgi:hypothetical protein
MRVMLLLEGFDIHNEAVPLGWRVLQSGLVS